MKHLAINEQQNLYFSASKRPQISADQCLIKVYAIGVNRADILQRQGKYPPPAGESEILGLEVCGEIVACGNHVEQWQCGGKVFGLVAGGGYAEYAVINAEHLMELPENYSYQQGAAIAEVFLTAYQSLFYIAHLKPKQSVLIHAGASGVGCAAIQLAKIKQCFVVVTVSSDEKAQSCLALGADIAINYRETDFVQWTKIHYKQGFDVIIDVVAGEYVNKNINVIALDGTIVILSMLAGRFCENIDIAKMLMKRVSIQASTLRNRGNKYKTELIKLFIQDFFKLFAKGEIKPVISHEFSWKEVESAHQVMLNNENIGKIVLTVEHDD